MRRHPIPMRTQTFSCKHPCSTWTLTNRWIRPHRLSSINTSILRHWTNRLRPLTVWFLSQKQQIVVPPPPFHQQPWFTIKYCDHRHRRNTADHWSPPNLNRRRRSVRTVIRVTVVWSSIKHSNSAQANEENQRHRIGSCVRHRSNMLWHRSKVHRRHCPIWTLARNVIQKRNEGNI